MQISLYPFIRATKTDKVIPVDLFFDGIRDGLWQDDVIAVRAIKDKDARQEEKKKHPYVTMAGVFDERKNDGLIRHSGLLAIDVDDVDDVNEVKSRVCCDPHLYAAFVSISGTGLCLVFKINPDKHLESFIGLQEYLFTTYELVADILCKDVSRPRYVSWDPALFLNESAKKFTRYVKREKPAPTHDVVFVQADFDDIVRAICERRIDITGGYQQWLKVCFALCDKLGEAGRSYFHAISQFSTLYVQRIADRQYTNCLKAGKAGITIASFYYLAKQAGIETVSRQTRSISQAAALAKKGHRDKAGVIKMLSDMEGIAPGDSQGIVDQVFDQNAHVVEEESSAEQAHVWLKQNYALRRNKITGLTEWNGREMTDVEFADIHFAAKVIFPKLDRQVLKDILGSNLIPTYHPILEFFDRYKDARTTGRIAEFFACIHSPTGWPGYVEYFGTKWLVGLIAGVFGEVSPLLLVLCGEKVGTGKTRVFIDLLPPELRKYFAIKSLSDMNNETSKRDLEIAMSKYLLILDDEMGGKSKRDEKKIKALLSLPDSTHRAAFGRNEERRIRLCGFGGTSNDLGVIGWDVGQQRRTIPVEVFKIDYERMNKISRIELLIEAYWMYKNGFDYQVLGDDVEQLAVATTDYHQINQEQEMILQVFRKPEPGEMAEQLTATQIKNALQAHCKEPLNYNKLGKALKDMGIESKRCKISGVISRLYPIVRR